MEICHFMTLHRQHIAGADEEYIFIGSYWLIDWLNVVGAVCKSSTCNATLKIWVIQHVAGTKFCPCNMSPLHDPSTCPLMCLEYMRAPIYFILHLSLVIVSCSGGKASVIALTLQVIQVADIPTLSLSCMGQQISGIKVFFFKPFLYT